MHFSIMQTDPTSDNKQYYYYYYYYYHHYYYHYHYHYYVSDIAVFVLKREVKLQPTSQLLLLLMALLVLSNSRLFPSEPVPRGSPLGSPPPYVLEDNL